MISEDYARISDWVAGFVLRQEQMPMHAQANLAQALMDLADRAALLERSTLRLEPECYDR